MGVFLQIKSSLAAKKVRGPVVETHTGALVEEENVLTALNLLLYYRQHVQCSAAAVTEQITNINIKKTAKLNRNMDIGHIYYIYVTEGKHTDKS